MRRRVAASKYHPTSTTTPRLASNHRRARRLSACFAARSEESPSLLTSSSDSSETVRLEQSVSIVRIRSSRGRNSAVSPARISHRICGFKDQRGTGQESSGIAEAIHRGGVTNQSSHKTLVLPPKKCPRRRPNDVLVLSPSQGCVSACERRRAVPRFAGQQLAIDVECSRCDSAPGELLSPTDPIGPHSGCFTTGGLQDRSSD